MLHHRVLAGRLPNSDSVPPLHTIPRQDYPTASEGDALEGLQGLSEFLTGLRQGAWGSGLRGGHHRGRSWALLHPQWTHLLRAGEDHNNVFIRHKRLVQLGSSDSIVTSRSCCCSWPQMTTGNISQQYYHKPIAMTPNSFQSLIQSL